MFRASWLLSSGVQVVEETTAPLSRCHTLHFKGVKYFILKLFLVFKIRIML
jgi:hypothetical protein